MNELLLYFFQGAIILSLLFGMYWIWLRKDTHFRLRRLYLIITILSVGCLPFVSADMFPAFQSVSTLEPLSVLSVQMDILSLQTDMSAPPANSWSWKEYLTLLLGLGFMGMLIRLAVISSQLIRIFRTVNFVSYQGHILGYSSDIKVPFSLFRYILLPQSQEGPEPDPTILTHEAAHVRYLHTLDILLAELFLLLFWFHPFCWLLKRSILEVHEYQVDNQVLKAGFDRKKYQRLLLQYSTGGAQQLALTNSFNQLITKKRITMMNKQRSSKATLLKYAVIIPALFLSMSLISYSSPISPGLSDVSPESILSEVPVPAADGFLIKGKVLKLSDKSPIIGATILIKDTKIGSLTDQEGHFLIKIPSNKATLRFAFVNMEGFSVDVSESGELTVFLDENVKKSRHVFKPQPVELPPATAEREKSEFEKGLQLGIMQGNGKQPLFVIDGVEQEREKGIVDLEPKNIKSIKVIKGDEAIQKYGLKGINGVIEVTSKKKD
ncbi:MAG: carboxypeptidase-like regulatory domain-containing protein [Bacteroidota bacterium]